MKKLFFTGMFGCILTGCLVPGAPHRYFFLSRTNKCDTAIVVSLPKKIEYQFRSCKNDLDSVFVLDQTLNTYSKLAKTPDLRFYYLNSSKKKAEIKKIEKSDVLYIKKVKNNKVLYDTLSFVPQPISTN